METIDQSEIVKSRQVIEMLTVANEYCLFLEKAEEYSRADIIEYVQKVCPLLYIKGILLPLVTVNWPEANERFVTIERWETLFNILRHKFDKDDEYWVSDHNDENITLKESLSDNLTDIYQDLKDVVLLYQKNNDAARENAVFECKSLFNPHWGDRIAKALHYLHTMQLDDDDARGDFWE